MSVDVPSVLRRLGIEAKRSGKEWIARCPNPEHDDRSPSWRIRDDPGSSKHGFMKCWPCGFGGTILDLIVRVLRLDGRREAREWLGEGDVDRREVAEVEVVVPPPRLAFRMPPEVRFDPIEDWPPLARRYFLEERALEAWQVERWGIGYAVDGRLRGRIVVPSRDAGGRPQRYTARSFVDDEKRYLEPENRERPNPNALFGEEHWPLLNGDENRSVLFLVEGAVNALALEAEMPGIYVAATSGSSMRSMYGPKLATWSRLFVMTDPDAAGDKLAEEIAIGIARHSSSVRARLPEGTDPAKLRKVQPGALGVIVRDLLR